MKAYKGLESNVCIQQRLVKSSRGLVNDVYLSKRLMKAGRTLAIAICIPQG